MVALWDVLAILLQNGAETFLGINVFRLLLQEPRDKKGLKYGAIVFLAIVYGFFLNIVPLPAGTRYLLSILIFFVYTLFFGGTLLQRTVAVAVDAAINMILSGLVYWLTPNQVQSEVIESVIFVIPNVLLLTATGVALGSMARQRKKKEKVYPFQWGLMLVYPVAAFFVTVTLLQMAEVAGKYRWLIWLDTVGLFIGMLAHFALMYLVARQNSAVERERLLQQTVKLEQEKVIALNEAYTEQRRMTHDFHSYLETLQGLIEQGDDTRAMQLIEKLLPHAFDTVNVVDTNNALIDALLNQKYKEAIERQIPVFFGLSDLSTPPIDTCDMVVVNGNLIDNAIEASEKVASRAGAPKPQIQVKIQKNEDEFLISFRNRVVSDVQFGKQDLPASNKMEKGHGFGLSNVIEIFKKYGVHYIVESKDRWFQVTGLLYLQS